LEASKVSIETSIPASRKLQKEDAQALLAKASKMIVARGKKVVEFKGGKAATEEAVNAMLGSTGNLRAPTSVVGKTLLVGFNEEAFKAIFH
jgi:arsenate reductase-like glutaredoxin family protein